MANETDTTAANTVSEEQHPRMPVFPARPGESGVSNGSDVPAQYKAIHEAQLLHEETIRQMREELRSYKQKLSDLADTSGSARPVNMDAVLMRLAELERKMGEGAPDPLLNEIVHRLASLESAGGGRSGHDPRVDSLGAQVDKLRKQLSDPAPADPRTDDVVLRIAAVEGSLKRAQQEISADRLEDLELKVAEGAASVEQRFTQRLDELKDELKQDLSQANDEASQSVAERIAAIEQRVSESIDTGSLDTLSARLSEIEQIVQRPPSAELPAAAAEKFEVLELRLAELAESAVLDADLSSLQEKLHDLETRAGDSERTEHLEERLSDVEIRLQQPAQDLRVDELASRISTVEEKTAGMAGVEAAAVEDLLNKVRTLENRIPEADQQQRIQVRLDDIEARLESPATSPELPAVIERISTLESHGTQIFESRLTELNGRLRAVELKSDSGGASDEQVSRLADRLDQLELTGSSGDAARQLSELRERVANLAADQKQTGADSRLEEKLEAAVSRLAELEAQAHKQQQEAFALAEQASRRIDAIEAAPTPTSEGPGIEAVEERLAALEEQTSSYPAEDPRIDAFEKQLVSLRAELGSIRSAADQTPDTSRIDALAEQIEQLRQAAPETPDLTAEIADIRAKIETFGSGASDSSLDGIWREMAVRIEELERQAARNGETSGDSAVGSEVGRRLDRVESLLDERGDGAPQQVVERLIQRLDALENSVAVGGSTSGGDMRDSFGAEMSSRFEVIHRRIEEIEAGSGGNAMEALQKESERWSQWARGALEEVGELRQQVEMLQEQGISSESGGANQQLLQALSEKIASGFASSEVKVLQGHVYKLYFAIFLLVGMVVTSILLNR